VEKAKKAWAWKKKAEKQAKKEARQGYRFHQ
jgi:hypothetical protein